MDSDVKFAGGSSDLGLIPNLGDVPLDELADQAAAPGGPVPDVVERVTGGKKGSAHVPVMRFNSAI